MCVCVWMSVAANHNLFSKLSDLFLIASGKMHTERKRGENAQPALRF